MIGVKLAQRSFFDRKPVVSATDRANRRVLSKFGAFVRTRARGSMKRRKTASAPGEPPSAHVGLIKQFLYFSYEQSRKSVVIGPAKLNKPGEAVRVLEEGGMATVFRRGEPKNVLYAKRPFMKPAFDEERKKMPAAFAGQIKG